MCCGQINLENSTLNKNIEFLRTINTLIQSVSLREDMNAVSHHYIPFVHMLIFKDLCVREHTRENVTLAL